MGPPSLIRQRRLTPGCIGLVAALASLLAMGAAANPSGANGLPPVDTQDVILLGLNSVRLQTDVEVLAGHVVANDAATLASSGVELGLGARTPAGYAVVGDRLRLFSGVVGGNAFYNDLTNLLGRIEGTATTPLGPFPIFGELPPFRSGPPGTVDVIVPAATSQSLQPGEYRHIVVGAGATLTLSPGIYNVRSIVIEPNAHLFFENLSPATVEVRLRGKLRIDHGSFVGPADADPLKASSIVFYAAHTPDPAETISAAVVVRYGSTIQANVYAPNGPLRIEHDVTATGAFVARDIDVGSRVRLDLETAFAPRAPSFTSADATVFRWGRSEAFRVTTTGYPAVTSITLGGATLPGGVAFVDNGDGTARLGGKPAADTFGSYALTFTAANGVAPDAVQNFTLEVHQAAAITSGPTAVFFVGQAGSFTVTTKGFPLPTIARGGALPGGVTFSDNGDGTGTLSGTPASGTGGDYALTFTATNSVRTSRSQSFKLRVREAPRITSANAAMFTIGVFGTFTVTTAGFPTPSILQEGLLPSGVAFLDNGDGTGTLSGTPAGGTGGTHILRFTARNGVAPNDGQRFRLRIQQPPAITSANSHSAQIGTALSFTVTTNGAPTPAITQAPGGAQTGLPTGVTFTDNADGTATLAGTVTTGGAQAYTTTITAANGVAPDATQSFTLTITCPAITVARTGGGSFPHGVFNVEYTGQSVTATGGAGAYAFAVTAGSVPAGLALAANGAMSGTPTATGTSNFTVTATDTFGCSGSFATSIAIGPNLGGDSYAVVGNTQLVAASHSSPATPFTTSLGAVLANDTADVAITVTAVTNAATTAGGLITLEAAGTFTYTPPVGQSSGTDSYVYTGTANGVSATATITFNIANVVWFVDNASAAATRDGRSNTPFTHMGTTANGLGSALAGAGPATGAFIYVHKGTGTTTGAYVFKSSQTLIGAGAALSVGALSIAGNDANTPTLGGTLTLASSVTATGFDMSTGTSTAITGTSLTGLSVTPRHVATTTGTAVNLSTVGGTFTFTSISSNGCGTGILVNTLTSGSFTVNGTGSTAGSGGTIQNCTSRGADFRSASTITLKNMDFTNNGTAGAGAVNSLCADALNQSTTALGTVGTLNCQANVYLLSTTAVTLDNVTANQSNAFGIWGHNVNGLTLTNVQARENGDEALEDGVQLVNQSGTVTVTGGTFKDNASRSFEIQNNSGAATVSIGGASFGNTNNPTAGTTPSTATAGDTMMLATNGTNAASITSVISGSTFSRIFGRAINVNVEGNTTQNVSFGLSGAGNGNTVSEMSFGTDINGTTSGGVTYSIVNNTFTNVSGTVTAGSRTPINARKGFGATGTWNGTVSGNVIGTSGVADSGCDALSCGGISLDNAAVSGTHDIVVTNNTIRRVNGHGIFVANNPGAAGTGIVRARIESNTLLDPEDGTAGAGGNQGSGIFVATSGAGAAVNVKAGDSGAGLMNSVAGNWGTFLGGTVRGVRFSRGANTAFCISGHSGPFDSTSVGTFLTTRNTGNPGSATQSIVDGLQFTGPNCATP